MMVHKMISFIFFFVLGSYLSSFSFASEDVLDGNCDDCICSSNILHDIMPGGDSCLCSHLNDYHEDGDDDTCDCECLEHDRESLSVYAQSWDL